MMNNVIFFLLTIIREETLPSLHDQQKLSSAVFFGGEAINLNNEMHGASMFCSFVPTFYCEKYRIPSLKQSRQQDYLPMKYIISSVGIPTIGNNLYLQHLLKTYELKHPKDEWPEERKKCLTIEEVSALRESGLLRIAALDIALPSTKI